MSAVNLLELTACAICVFAQVVFAQIGYKDWVDLRWTYILDGDATETWARAHEYRTVLRDEWLRLKRAYPGKIYARGQRGRTPKAHEIGVRGGRHLCWHHRCRLAWVHTAFQEREGEEARGDELRGDDRLCKLCEVLTFGCTEKITYSLFI